MSNTPTKPADKVLAVNTWVTARQTGGRILLFTPSDQTEAGHHVPANEIYFSTEDIKRLAEWAADE